MITAYAKLLSERSNNITKKSIMDDYLVDRETLSQFVDELIKKKALNIDFYDEKQLNKLQGFLLRRGFKFNEINDSLSEYRTKKENS